VARSSRSRSGNRQGTAAGGASGTRPAAEATAPTTRTRRDGTRSRPGRNERARAPERSFLERHRIAIIGGAVVVAVAAVAVLFLATATAPAYACSSEFQPAASADPSDQGQIQDDLGRNHVGVGTSVTYALCPPASGNHYNAAGAGPIQPRLYGPSEAEVPQGWIHNLEHGALVVLYRCASGDTGCTDGQQAAMRSFVGSFPASPVCGLAPGDVSPVVARFDQMPKPYAALVWGRVLYLDTFDTKAILSFFDQEGERTNPEPQCASPMPATSSPGAAGGASPSPAAASPSPS
jgi:hypothetical protein